MVESSRVFVDSSSSFSSSETLLLNLVLLSLVVLEAFTDSSSFVVSMFSIKSDIIADIIFLESEEYFLSSLVVHLEKFLVLLMKTLLERFLWSFTLEGSGGFLSSNLGRPCMLQKKTERGFGCLESLCGLVGTLITISLW